MGAWSFEPRRRKELVDELLARARVWLADWHPQDDGDFATALFKIAARIESEVTQRLDRVPDRSFRSFLDWLGVKGAPARAARLPVVFRMTPESDPITTTPPVQLQVNVGDTPINFETDRPLRIVPGELVAMVAADPTSDAFFLPPANVYRTSEPDGNPTEWRLKEEAPANATQLQLEPAIGLEKDMVLADDSGQQYHVTDAKGGIVTIDPTLGTIEPRGGADVPAATGLPSGARMRLVQSFTPFSETERNHQEHALYIGSGGALNIETDAHIEIDGLPAMPSDAQWWFSGKRRADSPDVEWITIDNWSTGGGKVVLRKPKGAIETKDVGGTTTRWVRATRAAGLPEDVSTARDIRLSINCDLAANELPEVKAIEGIANTTPLVLDSGFYPLGREPRQFDSFYLGSKEAFSKPAAKVTAHFRLGEALRNARAAIAKSSTSYLTFGVGEDGRLRRMSHGVDTAPTPPSPTVNYDGPTQPTTPDGRPIALRTGIRPGAALFNGIPHVSVSAGNEVWLWKGTTPDEWQSLDKPFSGAANAYQTVLTTTAAGALAAYALADGRVYRRVVGAPKWEEDSPPTSDWVVMLAPVVPVAARAGAQLEDDGVVAVTDEGEMFVRIGGAWGANPVAGGPPAVDKTFYPLVVSSPAGTQCYTRDKQRHPVWFYTAGGPGFSASVELEGHALDFVARGDDVVAVMTASDGTNPPAIAVWDGVNDAEPVFDGSAGTRTLVEGPLQVGSSGGVRFFFTAGADGEAFVLPVGQLQFVSGAKVSEVLIFNDPRNWATATEPIVDLTPSATDKDVVFSTKVLGGGANRWVMQPGAHDPIADGSAVRIHASVQAGLHDGTAALSPGDISLDDGPHGAADHGFLYVTAADGKERISEIHPLSNTSPKVATLTAGTPWSPNTAVQYKAVEKPPQAIDVTITVRPAVDITGIDPAIVTGLSQGRGTLEFVGGVAPASHTTTDVFQAENLAVLSAAWTTPPAQTRVDFFARVQLFGDWATFEPPTPRNPALSWEYYDGTAWRPIPTLVDRTQALAKAGEVTFCVPADLKETDVVGRKNHWIRARLVGGDYGQETLSVTTSPATVPPTLPQGSTVTTVIRNPGTIVAPYVGSITITYRVCCAVMPEAVVTRDNGAVRIQTDVNRTPGAVVEYFVPLSVALRRASSDDASAGDRAIYLGFNTPLTEGPIQILFLVNDGRHPDAFPLRVDALVANHFKPIAIKDGTRGLNETGVVEMTLGESPDLMELFGTTLRWLRIRPSEHLASDTWLPDIRAAYLNATFAVAADTQRFEQLGSSDGSPYQRVALTRPPIIDGSLKLRVLERLGDEDIDDLRSTGFDIQPTFLNFPKRQGCWVLWKQVVDPADEGPGERIYALDDATGVITFGDGLHGMIPPIGTNVLLAEEYQHGGGEAANRVTAWSQINLVTALAGVNAVIAPDGAAGGSDAQDPETTVRFAPANLRLRDRALTRADFEMLALQFSRDVAQARAIPTSAGTRLIVSMRGRDARPGARVLRELRTYLSDRALPGAAAPDALRITAPEEVKVRINVTLVIDAIEDSGDVATAVQQAIENLLDPAIGGHDGVGWPLGQAPSETDISAALIGIPHVETVTSIVVTTLDGTPVGAMKPWQLIRVVPDGVIAQMSVDAGVVA